MHYIAASGSKYTAVFLESGQSTGMVTVVDIKAPVVISVDYYVATSGKTFAVSSKQTIALQTWSSRCAAAPRPTGAR